MTTFTPIRLLFTGPVTHGQIEVICGTDWNDDVGLIEPVLVADVATDQPINLTDTHQTIEIRPTLGDSRLIALLGTRTGEILVTDAAAGEVQIFVPWATTTTWPRGAWAFRWLLQSSGEMRPVMQGPIILT